MNKENCNFHKKKSNTLYSDLSGSLSWDHPRSNTLYSDLSCYLSWDEDEDEDDDDLGLVTVPFKLKFGMNLWFRV